MTALYIRAWRCSHFASFTTTEAERPKFRESLVKETITRNLSPKQRELVDEEELQRGLRDEPKMGPREIIDFLNNLKAHKEALELDRARPEFSTLGYLSARQGHNSERKKPRTDKEARTTRTKRDKAPPLRGRREREQKGDNGNPIRRDVRRTSKREKPVRTVEAQKAGPGRTQQSDKKKNWIDKANNTTGPGSCWKCGRKGHSHRECRTYTVLTKDPCPNCNKGYHHPKACRNSNDRPKPTYKGRENPQARRTKVKNTRYTWTKTQDKKSRFPPTTNPNKIPQGKRSGTQGAPNQTQKKKPPFLTQDKQAGRVGPRHDPVEEFMRGLQDSP